MGVGGVFIFYEYVGVGRSGVFDAGFDVFVVVAVVVCVVGTGFT